MNNELITYLKANIIPQYNKLDLAHQENHVYEVIDISLEIAKDYDVDFNMVYTIVAFHDIGLLKDRTSHHLVGGLMLEEDSFINNFFNKTDIKIMKEAVEDHRASNKNPPRSIYGKIIAEADRSNSMDDIIKRCFLYRMDNTDLTFEELYPEVLKHINEKYGVNGYMKVYLDTKRTTMMLEGLRGLIDDLGLFKTYSKKIYDQIKEKD